MSSYPVPATTCQHCGRIMPRPRRDQQQTSRYCSKRCRSHSKQAVHGAIEDCLRQAVAGANSSTTSVDPEHVVTPEALAATDATLALSSSGNAAAWREQVRCAVRRLAHAGEVVVLQQSRRVDAATMRGPVRIRRGPAWASGPETKQ